MIVSLPGPYALIFERSRRLPAPTKEDSPMTRIGYARCSTDKQDLEAQRTALLALGVAEEPIYTDHGLNGTNRERPGLAQALAAVILPRFGGHP